MWADWQWSIVHAYMAQRLTYTLVLAAIYFGLKAMSLEILPGRIGLLMKQAKTERRLPSPS